MNASLPNDLSALAQDLLAQPAIDRTAWVATQRDHLSLALVEELKRWSDHLIHRDAVAAATVVACTLLVAEALPVSTLALPLAIWARGNLEAFTAPRLAMQSYQTALVAYQAAGDALSQSRLLTNLVFAASDCGQFAEADQAYQQAVALFAQMDETTAIFRLRLEQNYGLLLDQQGRYREALAITTRAIALAEQLQQPVVVAELQINRGMTLSMLGELVAAERDLGAGRAGAAMHGQALTVARAALNLGWLAVAQSQPAKALHWFQAAREQFAACDNPMELGTVLLLEADLLVMLGLVVEACQNYAQARAHFAAHAMEPQVGIALVQGAVAYRRYQLIDQATDWLDAAETLWRTLNQPVWLALVVLERATLALATGATEVAAALLQAPLPTSGRQALEARRDVLQAEVAARQWRTSGDPARYSLACASYLAALRYARRGRDRLLQREILAGLGRLALPDAPRRAERRLRAAAARDDALRQELSVEELKAGFQTQAEEILPLLATLTNAQGRPWQALSAAWRAKGSALLDLLTTHRAEERLPDAVRVELEQLQTRIAHRRLQHERALLDGNGAPADADEDPALRALEQQMQRVRRRANRVTTTNYVAALADPSRLLAQMDADVLIEYLRHGDTLFALRADREGACQMVPLGSATSMLAVQKRLEHKLKNVVYRSPEQRVQHQQNWLAECRPLLQTCYERLLAPLGPLPVAARLLIAPCPPLDQLPFAACWDGTQYLVERHLIEITPSGALLAAPPLRQAALSAPLVIGAAAGGALAAVRAEVTAIMTVLPSCIAFLDVPTTLSYLRRLPAAPRLLHIAAHTLQRPRAPLFFALQLTDEILTVEQCFDLPLAGTELVVLSGCTTASGLDSGGALLAFQSALFVAGAQRVLASLWVIGDQAVLRWMHLFYAHLGAGHAPAEAVRQTQLTLLDEPAYAHPALWAAFTCSRR